MDELVHEHSAVVIGHRDTAYAGRRYRARIRATTRDGLWFGYIEFVPEGSGTPLRTGDETSQPDRGAVEYWASGLEPIYLDGAFARAAGIAP
jgi:hypothetical protein